MICAHGGCHLPLWRVVREGCFASSGPFISMLTYFSKSCWIVALFARGAKEATKSPRPSIQLHSQHAQPGMVPGDLCIPDLRMWLLLPGLAGNRVVSKTHWHTHMQESLKWLVVQAAAHTHRAAWGAQPFCNATQTQRRTHCPVLFLPSRKPEYWFSGWKNVCPHSPHPETHSNMYSPLKCEHGL